MQISHARNLAPAFDQHGMPRHVGIIMDGTERWTRAHGFECAQGHTEGARAIAESVDCAVRLGVRFLTLHPSGVANWFRPHAEVESLKQALVDFAKLEAAELRHQGIRVNVIGNLDDMPTKLRYTVEDLIECTADGRKMTLTLALGYGARQDIVEAARALAIRVQAGLVMPEEIDEQFFKLAMTTSSLPDVDLIIRTGGGSRICDFLLFECAGAELVFSPVLWPDFTAQTLCEGLQSYTAKSVLGLVRSAT